MAEVRCGRRACVGTLQINSNGSPSAGYVVWNLVETERNYLAQLGIMQNVGHTPEELYWLTGQLTNLFGGQSSISSGNSFNKISCQKLLLISSLLALVRPE